jgi:hypothetical protein
MHVFEWMTLEGHRDATYLGDGLYASHDGHHIWLATQRDNGLHNVALEPAVFRDLLRFVRMMEARHGATGYWTGDAPRKADTQ